MKEIPLTRGKVALVDDEDYELVNQYKWYALNGRGGFYAARTIKKITKIRMHRLILGLKKGELCDHINHNGLDNRRCNLRVVDYHQNSMNRRKCLGKSSKFKGVVWDKRKYVKKWKVMIGFNGKLHFLGYFDDEIEAAKAYDKAAMQYFNGYAKLNFPVVDST